MRAGQRKLCRCVVIEIGRLPRGCRVTGLTSLWESRLRMIRIRSGLEIL
jgi:hypothetical protein